MILLIYRTSVFLAFSIGSYYVYRKLIGTNLTSGPKEDATSTAILPKMSLFTKMLLGINPLAHLPMIALDIYLLCKEEDKDIFPPTSFLVNYIYTLITLFNSYAWLRFKRVQV